MGHLCLTLFCNAVLSLLPGFAFISLRKKGLVILLYLCTSGADPGFLERRFIYIKACVCVCVFVYVCVCGGGVALLILYGC